MPTEEILTVPKVLVQILFDAVCNSMDFGSGFLDTEDVEALRTTAALLGVDPKVATPDAMKGNYEHDYRPSYNYGWAAAHIKPRPTIPVCYHCHRPKAECGPLGMPPTPPLAP